MLHENEQLGESGSTTSTFTVPLHKNEEVLTEKQRWKTKMLQGFCDLDLCSTEASNLTKFKR